MSFDWKDQPELRNATYVDAASRPVTFPVHLGSIEDELVGARDGLPLVVPLADRNWIRCQGQDAQNFLHNQLTSDVNHLEGGRWQHSSWCTAKGRMLASMILAKHQHENSAGGPSFLIQVASELRAAIAKRLKMYVLRSKVQIEPIEDFVTIGLAANDDDARRLLGLVNAPCPTSENACEAFADGWILRSRPGMFQLMVSVQQASEFFSALATQARPCGLSAWHWLEIQAGLIMVGSETQEEFVPQMVNFDKIGGVSFQKGCYPGQEIVARTQYLGKVKRHLYKVHAKSPLVSGMKLNANGDEGMQSAGVIATAAASPGGGFDALAVILESAVDTPIHADRADGPILSSIALVAA